MMLTANKLGSEEEMGGAVRIRPWAGEEHVGQNCILETVRPGNGGLPLTLAESSSVKRGGVTQE
jgi:hypothetical protein